MNKVETITLPMEIELAPHISPDYDWLVDVNEILSTAFSMCIEHSQKGCIHYLTLNESKHSLALKESFLRGTSTIVLPLKERTIYLRASHKNMDEVNDILVYFGLKLEVHNDNISSWTLSSLKEDMLIVKPSNCEPAVELKSMVYKLYEMSCNMVEQMDLYDYRCTMQENAKPDYYITRHNGIDEIHLSNMDIGDLTLIEEFIIKLIRKKEIAKE